MAKASAIDIRHLTVFFYNLYLLSGTTIYLTIFNFKLRFIRSIKKINTFIKNGFLFNFVNCIVLSKLFSICFNKKIIYKMIT